MEKTKLNKKDRIRGALYGVAVGDALGAPLEFMTAEEIFAKYGVAVREMVGGGWLSVVPGEVTDDTQMTLAVAEGIAENPENPIPAIGRRFIAWHDSRPKDIGNTCRSAIQAAKRHIAAGDEEAKAWQRAGEDIAMRSGGQNAGNGALMRTVYPSLYYPKDKAAEMAVAIGAMTHRNDSSDKYCKLYVELVADALDHPEGVMRTIRRIAEDLQDLPPTGWVVGSFSCAVKAIAQTETFEDAVVQAVNLGGDADTIGAIAGGLAGAIYGFSAIPERWKDCLADDVCSDLDRLTEQTG
jgi:ADP-ribosyl-(dinitrogen reductase) hydrolase|nr:MAG TPA: hypothetical protein [Caudoviricetes sp.]